MARVNVEAKLVSFLASKGFSCYADVPFDPPARYVIVDRTGGSHSECVDYATVAVDCVAESRYEASVMAHEEVDAAMPDFVEVGGICRVDKQWIQNMSHIVEGQEGLYRCVYTIVSADLPD